MATPNPLGKGDLIVRRRTAAAPILSLTAGFTGVAVLTFSTAALMGAAFGLDWLPDTGRTIGAALLCGAMCVVDIASLRAHDVCKLTLRRQTPKALGAKYGPNLGPLLWGMDTGLAATTVRVSSATWVVFALCILQLAPWWVGLTYGLGFSIPLIVCALLLPWRPSHDGGRPGEPAWIARVLVRSRPGAQIGCIALLLTLLGVLMVSAIGAV